ncbi:MAG TPA: hypothetical protein VGU22_19510 [Methylomirabilota bacterium]|jgi:hypothetical protein|nr:hypothetical protein [Methylomirabilota bacterium]
MDPGRPRIVGRRELLAAAVGFAVLRFPDGREPAAVRALHGWLSTWTSIGHIAHGMARQGFDLSLTRYDGLGWRATFYITGREHSPTSATASAFAPTPFRAVHAAAARALGLL